MPAAREGLTDAQRAAVLHRGAPLLVLGVAGSGKTRTLIERCVALADDGVAPETLLVLGLSQGAAGELGEGIDAALARPYEELHVHAVHGWCERLLGEEALAAGLDPFSVTATPADRLAMLLDRVAELSLRRHDFRGRPAALIAGFVRRIDELKAQLIDARRFAAWAAGLDSGERGDREREFAEVFLAHDRMLAGRGALDHGDLILEALRVLRETPAVAARVGRRWQELMIDGLADMSYAQRELITALAGCGLALVATADDDQAISQRPREPGAVVADFRATHRDARVIVLDRSLRCAPRVLAAAAAVMERGADGDGVEGDGAGGEGAGGKGEVFFWRAENERTQAQSVAAELEQAIGSGVAPGRLAVLVRSVADEGQAIAVALQERAVPFRILGGDTFFERAEIRDVLAWLRLLVDPGDSGAVVRALARPPVELRSIDIARCVQISRRRRLDMVAALVAATESPQLPPEARERILGFLKLHRSAAAALDSTRPDLFVHRLIDRLGLRRQQLFAAQAGVVERLVNLAKLGELAASYVRRSPQATPREFGRYIAAVAEAGMGEQEALAERSLDAVALMSIESALGMEFDHVYVLGLHSSRMPGARSHALEPIAPELLAEPAASDSREAHVAAMRRLLYVGMTRARQRLVLAYAAASSQGAAQHPSPFAESARAALEAQWLDRREELFGPAETLHSTFLQLRSELLESVARIGGRLGELRLDTDLDISHGTVRLLELLKLSALLQRPAEQPIAEAIADINARLGQAATPLQREILQSSPLDELLLDDERMRQGRAATIAAREEPSLAPFLPKRGDGLVLSASDIDTYRTCPLRYKFARVFRIPAEPTLNQRFGILVHQVLERFHSAGANNIEQMIGLLDAGWRRGGFGDSDEERQLRVKAQSALTRYLERFDDEEGEPTWFERSFSFSLGRHHLRGRVDRVDRLPDGGYELIDYKTGVPKTASQLRDDVQLALYAIAARESWQLDATERSYYYVLDDAKVPVPAGGGSDWIEDTVHEVADGILAQGFEPTPSYAACSTCDFRIACPAAEK